MKHLKKPTLLLTLICLFATPGKAQRIDVDLFGGISNYQGDLQPIFLTLNLAKPSGFMVVKYGLTENIFIRGGFAIGSLEGNDRVNRDYLQNRNLSFKTSVSEFHVGLEYRLIRPENFSVTPYLFAGLGVYHFNPYATYQGKDYFLQPLGTEGQGLPQYPSKKIYSLNQLCIPYGGGFKWQVNCNLNIGFEFGQRKLFTDYIDDVSGTFADEEILRNARGQIAVDLAFRRKEVDPNKPYPAEGVGRGNAKQDDWYYFTGLTIGLSLNDCETGGFSLGGLFKGSGRRGKSRTDCPTNVW
ncbi:MAG: DUF6089 family protein [Chitinophagaceae bacterium]